MFSSSELDEREANLIRAVSDPTSEYYKRACQMLTDASLASRAARAAAAYTTIPFAIRDADLIGLEEQFGVSLRVRGTVGRSSNTERVAGLMFVLEAALLEHAGSGGRNVLLVDGDLMSIAAIGVENRVVERTNCTARAAVGYYMEEEAMRKVVTNKGSSMFVNCMMLLEEVSVGHGEHFSSKLRLDGPRMDSIVFNHFRTPVGLSQAAMFVGMRGGVGYGAIPFQVDMRTQDAGSLECFPGRFYIDREHDTITLVPEADASMSISHPYSQLMEFVDNNGVMVGGREYLCEKYASVRGILYYTIVPINNDYEVPETLRTHFCNAKDFGITRITYPKARLSSEGVPVGYERGEVRILTSRLEKVMARAVTSRNAIVSPGEVFIALMDYNNMVANTFDSATVPDRMDVTHEEEVALAIALHVNWRRHQARGSLSVLLNAVKLKHGVKDKRLLEFAYLALSAWWSKPTISRQVHEDIPVVEVVDMCGNDFSVVVSEVNPWTVVEQDVTKITDLASKQVPYFPRVMSKDAGWYRRIKEKLRANVEAAKTKPPQKVYKGLRAPPSVAVTVGEAQVTHVDLWISKSNDTELTAIKSRLRDKMIAEQGAVNEFNSGFNQLSISHNGPTEIPPMPVPDVDPISAIRSDLDMIVGGLPERDAVTTGYRLADVEVDKVTRGHMEINDSKREVPKQRYVRRPKVDAGVEGKRVASSAATIAAALKRNVGIPNTRGTVDLDLTPRQNVERVINVCFREDWREVVNRHLNTGMWEPNEEDIDGFLSKVDERKASKMIEEFFSEGQVDLSRWNFMAKGKVKPAREVGAESKIDHSQTIMFLENSSTNGMYSAITRRVNSCLNECLREGVKLNPQWSGAESEEWYNSMEPFRRGAGHTYSYSADISVFDRSQEHPALRTEMEFYRVLGIGPEMYDKWKETHGVKRAMSMMYGIAIMVSLTGVSGLWKTLLRNGLITLTAVVVSADLRREDVVTFEVKGDDVDLEVRRALSVEYAVSKMSLSFNLSSKFHTNDVRYFCKNFRIKLCGRWIEIADPWARVQSLCTPVWIDDQTVNMREKWVSLKADLRHYENGLAVYAVAEAAQKYYGMDHPPVAMCMALSRMASDENLYMGFFHSPELVG